MQYSLKSMMIFFFGIVLLCAFTFALPRFISLLILGSLMSMLPAALVTGIVFGREDQRAFSIGGTATFGTLVWTNEPLRNVLSFNGFPSIGTLLTVVLTLLIVGGAGTLGVWTRRRLLSSGKRPGVSPPPVPDRHTSE